MTDMHPTQSFPILEYLRASGPHADYREELMLFGQFVGVWDMDIRFYDESGKVFFHGPGKWAFAWVLDGRVIQDVIVYADLRDASKTAPGVRRTGTTLRHYNPSENAWRVVWLGASSGILLVLTGRRVYDEIWIEGKEGDTALLRWMFTGIGPDRFHWKGIISDDGGATWRMEQEMFARRSVD